MYLNTYWVDEFLEWISLNSYQSPHNACYNNGGFVRMECILREALHTQRLKGFRYLYRIWGDYDGPMSPTCLQTLRVYTLKIRKLSASPLFETQSFSHFLLKELFCCEVAFIKFYGGIRMNLTLFLSHSVSGSKWWCISLCLVGARDIEAAEAAWTLETKMLFLPRVAVPCLSFLWWAPCSFL